MVVGMLGGGQLSLMLAEAGRALDIEVVFIDPAGDACAAASASQIKADYDDPGALNELADRADVVTYEFENVPNRSARLLSQKLNVFPAANALAAAQDRLHEKNLFVDLGIPVAEFREITTLVDLQRATAETGLPAVLKTRRFGYDGKGQVIIRTEDEIEPAWRTIARAPAILEALMLFDREVSIIAARDRRGEFRCYPLSENTHRQGVLHMSFSRENDPMAGRAKAFIHLLLDKLDYVGVLALELFHTGGDLYANEFASRVHNSGHWTIEGSACSQFENHMRAVAGLPLGDISLTGYSAMLNCLGTMPDTTGIQNIPGVTVHDYGKAARAGRKVGHITMTAGSDAELDVLVDRVRGVCIS